MPQTPNHTTARRQREELVDLRNVPELAVDSRRQDPEGAWARLRSGLVVRLLEAQMALPANVRLLVIEGYRPAALQEKYFTEYADEVARRHPDWPAPRVYAEASKHGQLPAECWHRSYGDRYWAASVGACQAVYGPQ